MLDQIIKSKIRQKLLLLFVYNQNKEFYLSEIAKKVKTSPGTAQRELNRLLNIDFITFKKKANLNIYKLNRRYSLLKEIESIVKKTLGIEVVLRRELSKINNIIYALIFGSYVKGGLKSDSDIDLFVIGNADENQIFEATQKAEKVIDREINYYISNENEFSKKIKENYFYRDIIKNHILLIGDKLEFGRLIKETN